MNAQLFWHNKAVTYVVVTLVFGTIYALNNLLTAPLLLAPGAHLVHLPSGFKFLLVLVFGVIGALSVFTVSLFAALGFYFAGMVPLSLELAFANALAPLLTTKFFKEHGWVQNDLADLKWKTLLIMGLLFSALNTAGNQMLLYWHEMTLNMVDGMVIMFIGDITGVLLVFGLIRMVMSGFTRLRKS